MDLPTLTLSLLGGFDLRYGAVAVPIHSARIRSLLAWLALHAERPQPRVRVASALWPDSRESQARTNLRNLIHQLRRAFPEVERYLDVEGTTIGWLAGAPMCIDVAAFIRGVADGRHARTDHAALARLEDALALYRGPLLPDDYDAWLAPEQERLRRMYAAGLESLMDANLTRAEPGRAREISERLLRLDPTYEPAHRARIAALTSLGDRAGAARALEECESVLAAELGVRPAPATVEARQSASDPARATTSAGGSPVRAGMSAAADGPLVGRQRELGALRAAWERALASRTRMVWVTGEPGIGKTRLVRELSGWIEGRGGRVAEASAYQTLGALSYGPAIAWLRSQTLHPSVVAAAPETRAELSRLLPEIADGSLPVSPAITDGQRRQRLHDAVLAVLARAESPLALVVDDLQWSDQETIDLLHSIAARSARPLLIIATIRTSEVASDHPLTRIGEALGAAARLERLALEPLDLDATGALARQLAGTPLSDADVQMLYRETEGNPLFIVETARSGPNWTLAGYTAGTGDSLSPRIRAVIESRLSLLSPAARLVVQVASAIGREFTLGLLLQVSPLDESETLRGLDEAWRQLLVRERGDELYDFSHGKIAEVAYRTTSPIRRRDYHQRIAVALEREQASAAVHPHATLDQVALHYDRGGSAAEAVEWYRRAADAAMRVSGLDAVRQLLGRAFELLARLPEEPARQAQELEMRLAYGSALVALEGYGRREVIDTYERARVLCERLGRPVTPPILRALALASLAAGDLTAGTQFGEELTRAAERDNDPLAVVEGAYVAGVMRFWRADLEASERLLRKAIRRYSPDRYRDHVLLYAQDPKVVCLSRLAWTLWHRGSLDDALACREEALAMAAAQDEPLGHAYALWFTMFIAVEQGDLTRLRNQTDALEHLATAHRLLYAAAVADGFHGYVQALGGDVRGGIGRMRATLEDRRWVGMEYVLKSQTLFLIAKAAAGAGDLRTAGATVADAMEYLGPGPSVWQAPLRQIGARVTAAGDRTGERAIDAFRDATRCARESGSAWTELGVAIDRGRWTLDNKDLGRLEARANLSRALAPFAGARPQPALAAGLIILERLTRQGDS